MTGTRAGGSARVPVLVDPRILVEAELEAFREVPQGAPS
ncbi:hypothetical protein C9F11_11525 [Streptomyces sp. YIM 121038]|nr:hypothetical protein C9F11_11525 [Streptomyces sp. YIM 121038]